MPLDKYNAEKIDENDKKQIRFKPNLSSNELYAMHLL
jgi:hypothetical protein